jgi:hypothetical protein
MRRVATLVLAALLLPCSIAVAQQCTRPADRAALDVAGLKSQLMVIALSCDVRDKYNSFVVRYRAELMGQERALQTYFRRAFGGRGEQQHDDYITSLANAQSEAGVHQGTLFCRQTAGLIDEVLALPPGSSLAGYAASRGFAQPVDFAMCPVSHPGTEVAQAKGQPR